MGVLQNLRLADLLLDNDLFNANSTLIDAIEMVDFDGSQSPVMNSASSSEPVSRQMPETSGESADNQMLATPSEQAVAHVELAKFGDQIVETGVTVFESEMVTPSSDLNEIAAVTRSKSILVFGNNFLKN